MIHLTDPVVRQVAASHLRQRALVVAAIALVTAIGMTVTLAAAAGAWRTRTALDRALDTARVADVSVDIDAADQGRLERIQALPEVEEVSAVSFTALRPADSDLVAGIDLVGLAPLDERAAVTMDRLLLQSGRLPDPDAPDEVLLDPVLARRLGVGVGDPFPIETYRQRQVDDLFSQTAGVVPAGPAFTAEIVGLAWSLDDITSDNQGQFGIVVLSSSGAEALLDGGMARFRTLLRTRLVHGEDDADTYLHDVFQIFGPAADTTFSQARPDVFAVAAHTIDVQALALALFAVGAALATAYAAGQAGARLAAVLAAVDDQPMRALGLERPARTAAASLPSIAGLAAGTLVAIPLAVLVSPMVEFGLADKVSIDDGLSLDTGVLLIGAVVLFTLLALRAHVAALRATGRYPARQASLKSAPTLPARLPTAMGVRTALSASRLAIVAVGVAVAGIVASVVFGYSLQHLTHTPRLYGFGWDVALSLQADGDAIAERERPRLTANPRVAGLAEFGVFEVSFGGEERASGLRLDVLKGSVGPTLRSGRLPTGDDEIAVDPSSMPGPGPELGDVLRTRQLSDDAVLRVVGLLTATGLGEFVVDAPAADRIHAEISDMGFFVRWAQGTNEVAAEAGLADRFVEVDQPQPPAEVRNLESVEGVPPALATFFLLIGLASVTNAMVLAAVRRGRDLAVTRALGFTRPQAAGVLFGESVTIAAIGIPLGLLLGTGAGRLAWRWVVEAVRVLPAPVVPLRILLLVAAGALVAVAVLGLVFARTVVRGEPGGPLRAPG